MGNGQFDQLTMHAGPLGDEDDFSFTFFMEASMRASAGVEKGNLVRCSLCGVAIPDQEPVWRCDDIEVIG